MMWWDEEDLKCTIKLTEIQFLSTYSCTLFQVSSCLAESRFRAVQLLRNALGGGVNQTL